jgi:hypothetical protein
MATMGNSYFFLLKSYFIEHRILCINEYNIFSRNLDYIERWTQIAYELSGEWYRLRRASCYPLTNEVAKGYSNATVRPSLRNILVNTLESTSYNGFWPNLVQVFLLTRNIWPLSVLHEFITGCCVNMSYANTEINRYMWWTDCCLISRVRH